MHDRLRRDLRRTGVGLQQPAEDQFGNTKFVATQYNKPQTGGDAPITLLAWGYEQKLQTVDRDLITRFYKKFVDKGPELVP